MLNPICSATETRIFLSNEVSTAIVFFLGKSTTLAIILESKFDYQTKPPDTCFQISFQASLVEV